MAAPTLTLSMAYRATTIAGPSEVRGATRELLTRIWQRGAVRPNTAPVWPILCIAWRDAGERTIHVRLSREHAGRAGRGRLALAHALFLAFAFAWTIARQSPAAARLQVVAFDCGEEFPLIVEQSPRPRML